MPPRVPGRGPPRRPGAALAGGAVLAAGLALGAWAAWVEPRRLVVRRETLRLPGWPPRLDGLRVAVLADLHAGAPGMDRRRIELVVARAMAEAPDLILLPGDFIDAALLGLGRPVAPEPVAEVLAGLQAPLGVHAVLGNHDRRRDGPRVGRALERVGIEVLENVALPLESEAGGLWLAGLSDEASARPDVDGVLGRLPDGATVIVLTHSPDVFARLPAGVVLTVAGHTHDGQVNIPFLKAVAIPSRYGDRYAGGHIEEDGRHLFVSAGLGTSGLPVRFRAPPEIALLTLMPPVT